MFCISLEPKQFQRSHVMWFLFFPRHFTADKGLMHFSIFSLCRWHGRLRFLGMSDNSHVICRFSPRFFGVLMCPHVSRRFSCLVALPLSVDLPVLPRLWMGFELHIVGLNRWQKLSPTYDLPLAKIVSKDGVIHCVFEPKLPQYRVPCWNMLRLLGKLNEKVNRKLSKCLNIPGWSSSHTFCISLPAYRKCTVSMFYQVIQYFFFLWLPWDPWVALFTYPLVEVECRRGHRHLDERFRNWRSVP